MRNKNLSKKFSGNTSQWLLTKKIKTPLSFLTGALLLASIQVNAEVGQLLWEDNFNTLNTENWHVDVGDGCDQGLCGWGNAELQWYGESNTYIDDVPGETGNKALVLEARSEASNGYAFTSGKVESSDKVAVQYGMIEVRLQIPDVGIGLWPAAWMLGTSTQSWPAKGEIDMMEMGQSAQAREDAGFPGAEINNYVGSNLIFYTEDACSDGNPTCAASVAWQNDNAHLSSTPLTNRFVTYRTYWTETEIRFTVEDNGVEYDMFDSPFGISADADEFQAPFFLLLNLAVGGNFTDAATNDQVTATTPAKMYIDYVRVYELDGQGEVFIGNQTVAEAGTFGVFTDTTPTNNKLEAGQTSDIYVWNTGTVVDGTIAPIEGDNAISWSYTGTNEWFGGGINTRQVRDMSNFADDGEITFNIKIPADVSFKIGIEDSYTNQNWLDFPANTTTYGLVRNGEWATATIPVADMRGTLIALQAIEGMFYIASMDSDLPSGPFEMAIDDIVWTGGGEVIITDTDGDGVDDILDNCANTPAGAVVDSNGCEIVTVVDSDNDGVSDDNDLCPDTATGVLVDEQGCTLIVAQSELIQAEDYTNFSDTTSANLGGEYRTDAVDIQVTSDTNGGYNVGWISSGEMLAYTLELGAGTYALSTRVASRKTGTYTISVDGQTINTDTVATSAWQRWETHELGDFTVDSGEHTITLTVDSGNFNINWLNLELIEVTPIDNDNDGVLDDVDQCLSTTAGATVDETGCEVVVDTDNDGVLDDVDQCLDTTEGVTVDENGCEVIVEVLGLVEDSSSSVEFFVNLSGWADVHYVLNNGGQQNLRMTNTGESNTRSLANLSTSDVISYFYTYQDDNGTVRDSSWQTHTFSGNGF
ncbi:carbohydrate-binding domain-containing protein [Colwellia echini]|uniref:Family 16 glycosylhydrolase n=1 Tax=Colwellia echini TaxID=1982103 RepID=A0ABY3MY11_9GAMM|nr:carbohydrate-binding domain-containing protein [Colwellia echini]TYK66110.1 family 16 glycosylhydrolase [Colwellia echini]